jgi:hypothetical protein
MDMQSVNEKVEGTHVNGRPQAPDNRVFNKDRVFRGYSLELFQCLPFLFQ